jgi:hypothetical protein
MKCAPLTPLTGIGQLAQIRREFVKIYESTKRTARARTSVEKRFPEFPFVMT